MPLSPPVGRQHLHTRRVTCQGFFREDGLWDIEGRITDEKTYEHANEWRGPLKPGDFVHDMSIRLTLDHKFTIVDVEAVTDKSPYRICGDVAPDFKKLIGLRIGGGFHREVRARGWAACTAARTSSSCWGRWRPRPSRPCRRGKARELNHAHRAKIGNPPKPAEPDAPTKPQRKPYVIDTCHAWAADGPVVKRWAPHFYTGPDAEAVARRRGRQEEFEMDD